ncbi:hypothetical protein ACYYIP_01110 [Ligilactobacillus equi]
MFLTLLISYYSMKSFLKGNIIRSVLFSLIYTITLYHLYLGLWNLVLGEFIAYTFLPLVFLGIYQILWDDYRKWYVLACGMSLLLYSHLLSVYLVTITLALIFIGKIIFNKGITKIRILSLIKSVLLTMCLSGFIIVPFFTDYIGADLATPLKNFLYVSNMSDYLISAINNSFSIYTVGLMLVIVLLVGWYYVQFDKKESIIYYIGVCLITATTATVPWTILQKTFVFQILGQIQFPYRLTSYACMFLSLSGSLVIEKLVDRGSTKYGKILITMIISLVIIGNYYSISSNVMNRITDNRNNILECNSVAGTKIPETTVVTAHNYNKIFEYSVLFGESDYYHRQEGFKDMDIYVNTINRKIVNKVAYLDGQEILLKESNVKANEIDYHINSEGKSKIDLPTIMYNRTRVYVNGKLGNYSESNRGTVIINLHSGVNKIRVVYKPSIIYYISLMICVFSWLLIATLILKNIVRSN